MVDGDVMRKTLQSIEASAKGYGIHKVVNRSDISWRVTCECGEEETKHFQGLDEDFMLKTFRNIGWVMKWNRHPKCPKCWRSTPEQQHNKKHREKHEKINSRATLPGTARAEQEEISVVLRADNPPAERLEPPTIELTATEIFDVPEPIEEKIMLQRVTEEKPVSALPDSKLIGKIVKKLVEVFDEDKKLYKPGWGDDRVAKDLDASLEGVIKVRKENFGELAEDPAITEYKRALDLVTTMFGEDHKKLKEEFDNQLAIHKKLYDQKLAELHAQFMKLPGAPHHKARG